MPFSLTSGPTRLGHLPTTELGPVSSVRLRARTATLPERKRDFSPGLAALSSLDKISPNQSSGTGSWIMVVVVTTTYFPSPANSRARPNTMAVLPPPPRPTLSLSGPGLRSVALPWPSSPAGAEVGLDPGGRSISRTQTWCHTGSAAPPPPGAPPRTPVPGLRGCPTPLRN